MTLAVTVIALVGLVAVALSFVAATRTVRDRRRPSNGLWLLGAAVMAWLTLVVAVLVLPEGTLPDDGGGALLTYALVLLPILLVLVLLIAAAVGLIVNTPIVVRHEGLRVATLVPLVIAAAIIATLAATYWWIAVPFGLSSSRSTLRVLLTPILVIPGAVLIFELVAYFAYAVLYPRFAAPRHADAVVVLGAGLSGDRVTPLLASRLDRGIEVLRTAQRAGATPVIVVSGGQGPDEEVAEADAMGDYLLAHGVEADVIVRERRSTTTEENLRFTVDLLRDLSIPCTRMAVVTSDFHVLRSASLTRRLGIDASAIGARTARYYVPSAFLREFAAMVVHFKRGTVVACAVAMALWFVLAGLVWVVAQQSESVDAGGARLAGTGATTGQFTGTPPTAEN